VSQPSELQQNLANAEVPTCHTRSSARSDIWHESSVHHFGLARKTPGRMSPYACTTDKGGKASRKHTPFLKLPPANAQNCHTGVHGRLGRAYPLRPPSILSCLLALPCPSYPFRCDNNGTNELKQPKVSHLQYHRTTSITERRRVLTASCQ